MYHLRRCGDRRAQRSWRDLLKVLDAVAKAKAGFRSLKDTWATHSSLTRQPPPSQRYGLATRFDATNHPRNPVF